MGASQEVLHDALATIDLFCRDPVAAVAEANQRKGISTRSLVPSEDELKTVAAQASAANLDALMTLANRLDVINESFMANMCGTIETTLDVRFEWRTIGRIGIYIPRRLPASAYTYLSSATAAGCKDIVIYLAQDDRGEMDPLCVAAALHYGAEIWSGPARFGFPALAYGLPCFGLNGCALVCGPCGARLNVLKHIACLTAGAAVDMASGPSELAILADSSANMEQVRLDMASQLEHGPDSHAQLFLVGDEAHGNWASRRNASRIARDPRVSVREVQSVEEAISILNTVGAETTELWVSDPAHASALIATSGVVYERCASSLGDYGAVGRGCADPTNGMARAQSGLTPMTFMRLQTTVPQSTISGKLRTAAMVMANYENLPSHRKAISPNSA